jgi:hypothetical protein
MALFPNVHDTNDHSPQWFLCALEERKPDRKPTGEGLESLTSAVHLCKRLNNLPSIRLKNT